MMKTAIFVVLLAGLSAASLWLFQRDTAGVQPELQSAQMDIAQGERLYAQTCAACHGANLEGQPDWQSPAADGRLPAPPHDATGHTWHHGDRLLFEYTKLGGNAVMAAQGMEFDSGMPGFGDTLSDAQIRTIIAYIQSTWPEDIREMQRTRTQDEP